MYIVIKTKDKQLKSLITEKRYTILSGIQLIEQFEKDCSELKKQVQLEVSIFDDGSHLSRDVIELGFGDGIQYISYLESKLLKQHKDDGNEKLQEVGSLIRQLRYAYLTEYELSLNNPEAYEELHPHKTRRFEWLQQFVQSSFIKIAGIVLTLFLVAMVGINVLLPMFITQTTSRSAEMTSLAVESEMSSEVALPALTDLLEQKRFEEAMTYYPQEYPFIERSIFYLGTDGIPYLEDFLKSKDYGKGWYDLAYLKKDYAKVIELKSEADTDERLTQLAVAYVKTGDIPQAEALNGQLMVASINDLILKAKEEKTIQLIKNQQYEEAKAIQAEINNDRIQLFFEELDKADAALTETTQKLSNPELKPEDKQKLEEQKNQLESHKQKLIDAL